MDLRNTKIKSRSTAISCDLQSQWGTELTKYRTLCYHRKPKLFMSRISILLYLFLGREECKKTFIKGIMTAALHGLEVWLQVSDLVGRSIWELIGTFTKRSRRNSSNWIVPACSCVPADVWMHYRDFLWCRAHHTACTRTPVTFLCSPIECRDKICPQFWMVNIFPPHLLCSAAGCEV